MFRKWLVSVVAAAFLAVGFYGCESEETKPAKPDKGKAPVVTKAPAKVSTEKAAAKDEKTPAPEPAPKKDDGKKE